MPALSKVAQATVTRPSDTTQYTAGDVVADSTSAAVILEFGDVAKFPGWGGIINAATLVDSVAAATKPDFDLYLFHTTVVMENDNAAWDPSDTEATYLIGIISFLGSNFETMGANGAIQVQNIGLPYQTLGGGTKIYGILVARNAYTPASAEVFTVKLHCVRDD